MGRKKITLRDWLYENKMSISQLSLKLGVNRSYMYRVLSGERIVSDKIYSKILELTQLKMSKNQMIDTRQKSG